MSEKPPPVLANARVLEYAVLDESVTYSGHSSLFVGNINEGLKELGPVACLAIAQDLKTGEIMLLHCDEEWDVLGRGGGYDSTAKAKTSAERAYHGVSSCWMDAKISHVKALKFRDEMWAEQRCSFCDKIPPDFNKMIERNNVRICDLCIAEFQKILAKSRRRTSENVGRSRSRRVARHRALLPRKASTAASCTRIALAIRTCVSLPSSQSV